MTRHSGTPAQARGRPRHCDLASGVPKVSQETERAILAARAEGESYNTIMAELGVDKPTVRRVIEENKVRK